MKFCALPLILLACAAGSPPSQETPAPKLTPSSPEVDKEAESSAVSITGLGHYAVFSMSKAATLTIDGVSVVLPTGTPATCERSMANEIVREMRLERFDENQAVLYLRLAICEDDDPPDTQLIYMVDQPGIPQALPKEYRYIGRPSFRFSGDGRFEYWDRMHDVCPSYEYCCSNPELVIGTREVMLRTLAFDPSEMRMKEVGKRATGTTIDCDEHCCEG